MYESEARKQTEKDFGLKISEQDNFEYRFSDDKCKYCDVNDEIC